MFIETAAETKPLCFPDTIFYKTWIQPNSDPSFATDLVGKFLSPSVRTYIFIQKFSRRDSLTERTSFLERQLCRVGEWGRRRDGECDG